jgi:hypothetical protein
MPRSGQDFSANQSLHEVLLEREWVTTWVWHLLACMDKFRPKQISWLVLKLFKELLSFQLVRNVIGFGTKPNGGSIAIMDQISIKTTNPAFLKN